MDRCLISLFVFCTLSFAFACSDSGNGGDDDDKKAQTIEVTRMQEPEFMFGFLGENKYSYCPSVIEQADGSVVMFFCGMQTGGVMVDNIYHVKFNADGTKTKEKSVLQPGTSGAWDDHHTCDPSVVEGEFKWADKTYKYALFYLSNAYGVYYNEIGVAFCNDLDGDSWVKYPDQLIRKTWNADGDQSLGNGSYSWGVGQPSAVSLDKKGKVLLTYTCGDVGGTKIVWRELDMSDIDNMQIGTPHNMVQTELYGMDDKTRDTACNADFAINTEQDKILMIRPVSYPSPTEYPTYININLEIDVMNLSDFLASSGRWTKLFRITPSETGFPRNHNAAISRDSFGHTDQCEYPTFYYSVSKASPDVYASGSGHAEWTYHIYRSKLYKKTMVKE